MRRKLIYLFCLILALSLVTNTTVAELVAYYPLNEGSGNIVRDASGNGLHGTIVGRLMWADSLEGYGTALEFDGVNDYVDCGNKPAFDIIDQITVACWIKVNTFDKKEQAIVTKGREAWRLNRNEYSNKLRFNCNNAQGGWISVVGSVNMNDGQWHHVAGVYDGSKIYMYIDGTLDKYRNASGTINTNSFSVLIGKNAQWEGCIWNGLIDDVRIYSHALNDHEVAAIYAGEITGIINNMEIIRNPEKALRKAYENLQQFSNWRTNTTVKTEYAGEIIDALLIIAKAKKAKGSPIEEVLDHYYKITKQFPDSLQAITALCEIATLDKKNGLEYAINFLEKSGTTSKIRVFYTRLIKNYMTESDYVNAEKYVKLFIDKYISTKKSVKLVGQLISSIGQVENREKLDNIIERNISQNPNAEIYCGFFRYRALQLSRAKKFDQVLEQARWIQAKLPGTKVAACATAALADNKFEQGNYIFALRTFKPKFLTQDRPESEIIKDIDSTLTSYKANTLRTQGIDSGKVYEALAKYTYGLGWNAVAVHCYKKNAMIRGFDLQKFEDAASENIKYSNSIPNAEVWFWKGLFAVEEGDLMAAGLMYERFLKTDTTSVLAARAYYDTARARMALGQYFEARDAIAEAKRISPCESVIQLEREIADPALSLRGRRESSTNTKM